MLHLGFERFVDLSHPHRAAVKMTVSADRGVQLRTRAGINAHVENTGLLHWNVTDQETSATGAWLATQTRSTGIVLATAVEVTLDGAEATVNLGDADGAPAVEHTVQLDSDQAVTLTKYVAVVPDVDDAEPIVAARRIAREAAATGWDELACGNAAAWATAWQQTDVRVDGDPEAQIALRFNLFQLLVAAPRFTDKASIGAKTLSGYGYRHHAFWDTELFMLPVFTFTDPAIARNMLRYRWHGLAGARRKALANGYRGAQFPWESAATGDEVTPTWVTHFADPTQLVRIWTGDIEIHITADIALAIMQYWRATGDAEFMVDSGAEMILDGARFWASAATLEDDGRYHYRNVIGPDEYHDRIDDNAYTNVLAAWHLRTAAEVLAWLDGHAPTRAAELRSALALDAAELARWEEVASAMYLPVDAKTGLIEQFDGYFGLPDVDLSVARDPGRTASMQALLGIDGCAETQNIKQPDVLMLAYLLPENFSAEALRVNYEYYDPRTDHEHGSSLGPAISAVMACRAGDPELGYEHFLRAARADLVDVRHNAGDGIHGASAGGLWQAAVFGFAGLTLTDDGYQTKPMLPASWQRVAFNVSLQGTRHQVVVER